MAEKEKNLELKKHVAAIHSSNKLSLVQRKIANALLFNAYDELLVKDEHQIHIRALCNLIGYDSNDYKTIRKALVNLLSTVIEWNLVDGNKLDTEGVWNASSIIADASIDGPVCSYSYSNKMKKLLHTPELYGRLNMLVQAKFQSSYGLALYENCVRYQNIEQTPWFDLPQFRKLMGIEDGKYMVFRDFKRRVLDKAIEEVNKYSSLRVTPKFMRHNRQVVAIQFLIKHANELTVNPEIAPLNVPLSQQLRERFSLSKTQVEETMSNYDEKYILEKIALIESSSSYVKGKINNIAKYLLTALEEDYQPTKSSRDLQKIRKMPSLPEIKPQKLIQADRSRIAYRRYQEKQIMAEFNKQSSSAKKKLMKEFEQFLGRSLYFDIYLRDGLANVLVMDQLCEFIRAAKPMLLKNILSYEDYNGEVSYTVEDCST